MCYKTRKSRKMNPSFEMIPGQKAILVMIRTQGNPHIYDDLALGNELKTLGCINNERNLS